MCESDAVVVLPHSHSACLCVCVQGQVNRAQEAESMYVLQKEVRLLRRISKKVLDESTGSPESEAGSHTEGTPVGYHTQWSMSREDSEEEEGAEVSSEVRAQCVYVRTTEAQHAVQTPVSHHPLCSVLHMYVRMYVHDRTGALYAVVLPTWHCMHQLPNATCASIQMYVCGFSRC